MSTNLKECKDCLQSKPVEEFYEAVGYKNGIMSRCKACHYLRTENYRKDNTERINELRRTSERREKENTSHTKHRATDTLPGKGTCSKNIYSNMSLWEHIRSPPF